MSPCSATRARTCGASKISRRAVVEIEHHHGGLLDPLCLRERGVQLEVGEVGRPYQRGKVVGEAVIDPLILRGRGDRRGLNPLRAVRGAALLIEEGALDA